MKKRILWILPLALLVALLIAAAVTFFVVTRRPFPKTSGRLSVPGLSSPVEVLRDRDGVPHIYAENSRDLYFAQGFVHAQDRFWQMEFWRRLGSGRLSEYFGESTLGIDRFMRTMGFTEVVKREYAALPTPERNALDAYVAGVNAYIEDRTPGSLGLEFFLLRLQGVDVGVDPWKPEHSMTWLKIMAYDLGGNLQDELNRLDLLRLVGRERAEAFYPDYRDLEIPYIVSTEELEESLGELSALAPGPSESGGLAGQDASLLSVPFGGTLVGGVRPEEPLAFGKGGSVGSNSWVIGGELTETGLPILAADLHLAVQMPSIWYEVMLYAEEDRLTPESDPLEVGGFSFAGVPGVIVGNNDRIAWGLTNVNPDVQDLYLEQINPEDPKEYRVGEEWRKMELRVEEIRVHGRDEPVRHLVRRTRNGPIVSDPEGSQDERSAFGIAPPSALPESITLSELSLRWTALEENRTFQSVFHLNRATDFKEFRRAAELFDIPSQNLVYADREGNIGYQTPGRIPIRQRGDGTYPVPGWEESYQWQGYIPFNELPWVYNPEKGYIVTANNPVAPPAYPYHLTADFNYGHRARRITEMIEAAEGRIGLEDVAEMQGDTENLPARTLLPYVLEIDPQPVKIGTQEVASEKLTDALDLLAAWNLKMERDSTGAALYAAFFQGLLEEMIHDEIPEEMWSRSRLLKNNSRIHAFLEQTIADPNNLWWDRVDTLETRERRDDILPRALARGILLAEERLGPSMEEWRWGDLHQVTFRNQTFGESEIALIEKLFNRGPLEVPSGLDQVFSADFDLSEPFKAVNHSSMRQIIDLSELDNSRLIHSTGQSGHPYHRHYADFMEPWREVEYHPRRWSREAIEGAQVDSLTLEP